jgi:hypothetical protein
MILAGVLVGGGLVIVCRGHERVPGVDPFGIT